MPLLLRRTKITALLGLVALFVLARSAYASATTPVIERPVSFQVTNTNESKLACSTDGGSYTVRGHLIGTKAELRSPRATTLYLHGLGLGEFFWNYKVVKGLDFAADLAERGHVSVTINRLGYQSSGKPQGLGSCIGGQADIAHQIIGDLKSGKYRGSLTPKFKRVGLIGHSAGGQIAEVEGYSFGDAAAIGVLAYADQGFSPFQLELAAGAKAVCDAGGEPSNETSGPGGYAKLGQTKQQGREAFFSSASKKVQFETLNILTANPCGDLASYAAAPATDLANLGAIKVPVLTVQGGKDALFPVPDVKTQSTLFTGSSKVTYAELPKSGHALTLESEHLKLVAVVAKFLTQNQL